MIHTDRLEYFNREENDRQFGQSLITISLINVCSSAFFSTVRTSQVLSWKPADQRKGKAKARRESRNEARPRFPTLFLAPASPSRLKQTLPRQRDCLSRCPNSQSTRVSTLTQRQRHSHTKCFSNSI